MARKRRSVMLWALAAVAGAHGLMIFWLAAQASLLKFRADPVADRSAVLISLQPLPSAAVHPHAAVHALPSAEPTPAPSPAPSGPQTIDEGQGTQNLSNLAKPVFLDWPHPTPSGVDWGRSPPAGPALVLSEGWAGCRHAQDKDRDETAWTPAGQVKAPCLRR